MISFEGRLRLTDLRESAANKEILKEMKLYISARNIIL